MTPGTLAAAAVFALTLLVLGITLFALGWPGLMPRRRRPEPFQHPALPPMAESDVDGDHDWDAFLAELVEDEYQARLREQAIEIPREGETA
jgi:hypothetical protein